MASEQLKKPYLTDIHLTDLRWTLISGPSPYSIFKPFQ